ncbi:hypothetical protein D9756_001033 [Leucocoprinus leucothites]|uniref:Uncharacterized protein n=1 Tax=Leucocoprinus leucothites TaxID=201217 RepID=A0A8H5LNE4_9AGAR|nr:hypothetical protein D9756_001033 [Leucoagaricus leucothites]
MRKSSTNSETVASPNTNGDNDMVPNTPVSPSTLSSMASNQPRSHIAPSSPKFLSPPKTGRRLYFGLPFLKAGEVIKGAGAEASGSASSNGRDGLHLSESLKDAWSAVVGALFYTLFASDLILHFA